MKKLTIFTPTYNRSHTLPRTYESLKKQNNKDFIWLIIDDGSTDQTKQLVKQWQKENQTFEIEYRYKENGGMHTVHNLAYDIIKTELNVCIDSDDCLAEGAVENILRFWERYGSEKYAGIIGLDADLEGNLIGSAFEDNITETTLSGYYAAGGTGDKKLVYRTEVMKQYPKYPVFEGEKYVGLNYKYILCDQDYSLLVLNQVLCNVEYQQDGSSNTMWKQYMKNPKGFAFLRKVYMTYPTSKKRSWMDNIHYVSSSILSENKKFVKESPRKGMTIAAIPLGIVLTMYVKKKAKQ